MKGAIFDLDGTLVDSMFVWESVDTLLLSRYHLKPDPIYLSTIATLNFSEGAAFIISHYGIHKSIEQIKGELFSLAYDEYAHKLPLKKGVADLLRRLKYKEGMKLAIATSCIKEMCEVFLRRAGIYEYFDAMVFSDDVGCNKMKPLIYEKAATAIGLYPKDCFIFEDVPHAARSAKEAGAVVIGVYDAYSANAEEEMKVICDRYLYCINDF